MSEMTPERIKELRDKITDREFWYECAAECLDEIERLQKARDVRDALIAVPICEDLDKAHNEIDRLRAENASLTERMKSYTKE